MKRTALWHLRWESSARFCVQEADHGNLAETQCLFSTSSSSSSVCSSSTDCSPPPSSVRLRLLRSQEYVGSGKSGEGAVLAGPRIVIAACQLGSRSECCASTTESVRKVGSPCLHVPVPLDSVEHDLLPQLLTDVRKPIFTLHSEFGPASIGLAAGSLLGLGSEIEDLLLEGLKSLRQNDRWNSGFRMGALTANMPVISSLAPQRLPLRGDFRESKPLTIEMIAAVMTKKPEQRKTARMILRPVGALICHSSGKGTVSIAASVRTLRTTAA